MGDSHEDLLSELLNIQPATQKASNGEAQLPPEVTAVPTHAPVPSTNSRRYEPYFVFMTTLYDSVKEGMSEDNKNSLKKLQYMFAQKLHKGEFTRDDEVKAANKKFVEIVSKLLGEGGRDKLKAGLQTAQEAFKRHVEKLRQGSQQTVAYSRGQLDAGALFRPSPSPGLDYQATYAAVQSQPPQQQQVPSTQSLQAMYHAAAMNSQQQQVAKPSEEEIKVKPKVKKRTATAENGDAPAAKKSKAAKKEAEDDRDIFTADDILDMEAETTGLMIEIKKKRLEGQGMPAKVQPLSEWRIANQAINLLSRAGLDYKRTDPRILEVCQVAFHQHAVQLLTRAVRAASHRRDTHRNRVNKDLVDNYHDPRYDLGNLAKREKDLADIKAAEERDKLLKLAGSKRADEETKEKAKLAKAEMQGKQQAVAANAALAATMGMGDAKWNRWGDGGAVEAAPPSKGQSAKDKKAAEGKGSQGQLKTARSRAVITGSDEPIDIVAFRDIIAVLERDPMYCCSELLYCLQNGILPKGIRKAID